MKTANRCAHRILAALLASTASLAGAADPAPTVVKPATDLATAFGTRELVHDVSLSPDGAHAVLITAGAGHSDVILTMDLATGASRRIGGADGEPLRVASCGWSSNTRLVCQMVGNASVNGIDVGYSRLVGIDADGGNVKPLGRRAGMDAIRVHQFDGDVIDWRGGDGWVLMARDIVGEQQVGSVIGQTRDGLGVELVDTATGKSRVVEQPGGTAVGYLADGRGTVRIKQDAITDERRVLTGTTVYSYRLPGDRSWKPFSRITPTSDGYAPLAVDGERNVAYAAGPLDGRQALYRIALDGTMKSELVSSNPEVDVASVVPIGRQGRVIGATYVTDRRRIDYFDPTYKNLAAALARALPKTPLIRFLAASADESRLLVFAGSDVDPGHYYLYTRANRHLDELARARADLEALPLTAMQPVSFKAADGTAIPAYLTLPPGGARKGLPAIVLPHGGPSYRDEWGFDWLVQYFAQSGFAVLQPNFRGSSGYGDAWYGRNGFRAWATAIGDVADAGRWLLKEGIADPAKLAIVGWSYGGYAALQANVVDPDLFKAVVAIAPVTDLAAIKRGAADYTNQRLVQQQIGSGAGVAAGSPARHAEVIKAPVLLFHGDRDLNVDVEQSRLMDAALRRTGGKSTLVEFPKLDHQLDDSEARATMLARSTAFLKDALKM